MRQHSLARPLQRLLTLTLHFALLGTLLGLSPTAVTRADDKGPTATSGELQLLQVANLTSGLLPTEAVLPPASYGQTLGFEIEANNFYTQATAIANGSVTEGTIFPANDSDYFSFTATAGDRVYAATMTSFDASASGDTTLNLYATDGTTILETDLNDGSFNGNSSTLAGTVLPSTGTYYLQVRHNLTTSTVRPYRLYAQVQSGAPVAEVEANGTPATANPLFPSGWVTGIIDPVADTDFYSLTLNAGDSVFLSLDLDPERDAIAWNGRLGLALFGNPPANQILVVNDASVTSPNSEAFFMTVKDGGTYYAYVDSPIAGTGGVTFTYNLNATVIPVATTAGTCTTYTSTDVPLAIPSGPGIVTSTLTIPGNPIIADLDVTLNITHTFMQDLDLHLVSPAGNNNGLLTDVGGATVSGTQTLMDLVLDDEAALPPAFALSAPMYLQPELAYRLSWFDGINAGGTWSLVIRDDATGDAGTLNSWSLRICEPPPPPACPGGSTLTTLFSTDFEASDAGFTHSGTLDEWERGLPAPITPATNPISTCNSGINCWKTDLDNTYDASSSQNLLSSAIPLTTTGLVGPLYFSWAQRYHIESATFDHASVDVQLAGGGSATRLWEWLGATMNNTVGNPAVTIAESGGWGVFTQTLSNSYIGQNIEALFHLDSDTTVQLSGWAIDDVSVSGCVTITNTPPNANAGTDQSVYVNGTVTLNGSASNDPDNNLPLTYGWVQSGGPAVTLSDASIVSPTFTAPSTPTVLTFTLTVTDSLGAFSEPSPVVVTVGDEPINEPGIDHDSPTNLGSATHFTGSVSTGTNVVYSWDFGDGNIDSGQNVTHTYALSNTYMVTMTATNGFGSAQATTQVTVINNLPTISNTGNQTGTVGVTHMFTVTVSDVETPAANLTVVGSSSNQTIVPNANIVITGTGAVRTVLITPTAPGAATITLQVIDAGDASQLDTFVLTVWTRVFLPLIMR